MRTFNTQGSYGVQSIRWLGPVREVADAMMNFIIHGPATQIISFNARMLAGGEQEATVKWRKI